jgi:hypothetical protein
MKVVQSHRPYDQLLNKWFNLPFQKIYGLFDMLNSRSPFGRDTKEPLNKRNWASKRAFLEDMKSFLMSLTTVEGIPLYKTRRSVKLHLL